MAKETKPAKPAVDKCAKCDGTGAINFGPICRACEGSGKAVDDPKPAESEEDEAAE